MGAALLREPEKLERILRTLVEGLPSSILVSAKIRLLPTVEETIGLARRLTATGIKALTLHARTPEMRPHHPALWEVFSQVAKAIAPIPLIANGDFYTQECVQRGRATLDGVSSFMIGRGAQWNVSVFRPEGPLALMAVSEAYLRKAAEVGALVSNAKFTLLQMWMGAQEQDVDGAKAIVKALQAARSYEALGDIFGIQVTPLACSEELIEASAED
jgi:tRNA-dihydrouridine synthase 2